MGEKVTRCWQYFLSPQEAEQAKYSQFINTWGGLTGRYVSADLHMEHLNWELKDFIAATVASKTNQTICWLAKALGLIALWNSTYTSLYEARHSSSCESHQRLICSLKQGAYISFFFKIPSLFYISNQNVNYYVISKLIYQNNNYTYNNYITHYL